MTKKSVSQLSLYGKGISLNKAAKKYQVPQRTLSDWAAKGELRILKHHEKRGQAMLVDEASVVMAILSRKRGYALGAAQVVTFTEPTAVIPAKPAPELSTAEMVDSYHHYGETIGFKPTTLEKHRQVLKLFTERCPTLPMTPDPILQFIHDLKVGMRTKKKYYEVIRQLYNYLKDFKSIPSPLSPRMVPRAERHPYFRVLSREELLKVFNAAETFQEKMILETLYCTRVRVSELVSLTSDRLFPDHIVVTGKTGTWEVPITEDLYDQLQLLGEGPLFRDDRGKPITRDGVYQRVAKCLKAAGIEGKKLGPHTLRHTSLTHLYEDTADLPLVQEAAHHADLETTMIYTHPRAVKQREKLLRFDPMKRLGPKWHTGPGDNAEQVVGQLLAEEEPEEVSP